MTERERFEEWGTHLMLERQGDAYVSHYTNHAWRAWNASRHRALEEAASECVRISAACEIDDLGASWCEDRIRDMMDD